MSIINKQKFLTELEKLLTFMHQEDRATAIAMYAKMFDLASDEGSLITALVSPTRQAVQMARAYDANERKLAIAALQSGDEEYIAGEDTAPFIVKIKEIFETALDSMPDDEETPHEVLDFAVKQTEDAIDSLEQISKTKSKTTEEENNIISEKTETETEPVVEEVPAAVEDIDFFANQVDEFLKDFKIQNAELLGDYSEETSPKETSEEKEPNEEEVKEPVTDSDSMSEDSVITLETEIKEEAQAEQTESNAIVNEDDIDDGDDDNLIEKPRKKKEKKPKNKANKVTPENKGNGKLSGSSLALFLLIAIPLTAIGLIIVFALAIAVLAAAAAGGLIAVRILSAAFGSFRVFADVLVVTGTGFVVAALSLLLLWTAIWIAFGVSAKMINGIINLAMKICTKEDSDK